MRDRRAHVKISRRFFEEDPWWSEDRRFSRAEAWLDLIQMAAWKTRRYSVGLTTEVLHRGEFMASIRYLGRRWRWSKSAVDRFLEVLEKAGRIAGQRKGHDGTVYLLVKYAYYHGITDESGTLSGTPGGTVAGQSRDKTEEKKEQKEKTTWLTPFAEAWSAKCGNPPMGRLAKCLAPLAKQLGEPEAALRWTRYLAGTDTKFCSPERFVATHAAYAGPAVVEMTDDFGVMRTYRRTPSGELELVA